MLREVWETHGKALQVGVALSCWGAASVAALFLCREDWQWLSVAVSGAVLYLLWPTGRQFARALGWVALWLWGGLLLLELGLRLWLFGSASLLNPTQYGPYAALIESGAVQAVDDPELLFGLKPNYDGHFMGKPFRTNAEGFRAPSWKSPREGLRVMAFGTSITMGAGVLQEEAWPAVLATKLRENGKKAEGFSLGVGAYGARQIFHLAKKMIVAEKPDLAVVEIAPSGLYDTGALVGERVGRDRPLEISSIERYSFAATAIYPPSNARMTLSKLLGLAPRVSSVAASTPSTRYIEEQIQELVAIAKQNNVRLAILLVRPMSRFAEEGLESEARVRLAALCTSLGVLFVDTYPRFAPNESSDRFIVFPGDLHPNAAAHMRFATVLYEAIVSADGF